MFKNAIAQFTSWVKNHFKHQSMLISLSNLDERELKDMGITKYDIHAIGKGYYDR